MTADIVIGIDGGGTHTQAIAISSKGQVLATAHAGGASPRKTPDAVQNVRSAITEVLVQAKRHPGDVRALVAGLAGMDTPADLIWAEQFTALTGLTCPRSHVNDAVVAHAGALASQPGIIAIAGTGSNVFGVTEDGRQVYGHEFHHYAPAAARYISYKIVHSILAGRAVRQDRELETAVLAYWEAADVTALRAMGVQGFIADELARNRHFAEMAPLVTAAAERGEPLACSVCDQIAEAFAVGINLVGGCFCDTQVRVALIGSVANDVYMKNAVIAILSRASHKQYQVVSPAFSGAHGAALMALNLAGYEMNDKL